MAESIGLKPTHATVRGYTTVLAQLANVGAAHESAVREAWHRLIEHCAAVRPYRRSQDVTRFFETDDGAAGQLHAVPRATGRGGALCF